MSNVPSVVKSGYDTWVGSIAATHRHGSNDWMRLKSGEKRGLLWMPVPARVAGRTIPSAFLTLHAHGTVAAQTLTITPLGGKWHAKTATWNNQPATTGTAVTKVIAAPVPDGGEIVVDVTSLIQQIADGQDNLGWRISTNATSDQVFATFNSGKAAFRLDINYTDKPDAPTGLAPNGTVVSEGLPISTFDYTTFGGADSDLAKVKFQIDKGNNGTIDYTSPYINITTPQVDLSSASASVTVAAGDVIAYRYLVQDAATQESDWSDWAVYTYQPLPTLTLDSPVGGHLYDPTSDILAHISTANLEAFRVQITDGDDRTKVRYDSKKQPADDGSNIAWALPLRTDFNGLGYDGPFAPNLGSYVFPHDGTYQGHIVAWDDYEREATPGAPAKVELWFTFDFTDSGTVSPVTSFSATQVPGTPLVDLSWTDAAAPDAYVLMRNGTQLAKLDPADVSVGGGFYAYQDNTAQPAVANAYSIRRITDGVGRSAAVSDSITYNTVGFWIIRPNGDQVVLAGEGIDQLAALERRLVYKPVNLPYDMEILTAYEGISGPVAMSLDEDLDQTFAAGKAVLDAVKNNSTEVVRCVYGSVNKPFRVSQMDVEPDPSDIDQVRHIVRFIIKQAGEFDFEVG